MLLYAFFRNVFFIGEQSGSFCVVCVRVGYCVVWWAYRTQVLAYRAQVLAYRAQVLANRDQVLAYRAQVLAYRSHILISPGI